MYEIAKQKRKIRGKKAINVLIIFFLTLILSYNVYNIISRVVFKNDLPKFFGYANAVIVSGSMADAINVGDLIIIKEQQEYEVEDIITYRDNNVIITHRLTQITETGYITKGDANNTSDDEITFSQIEGKVIYIIPKVGLIVAFFKTPLGMLLLMLFVGIMISSRYIIEKISDGNKKDNAGKD